MSPPDTNDRVNRGGSYCAVKPWEPLLGFDYDPPERRVRIMGFRSFLQGRTSRT